MASQNWPVIWLCGCDFANAPCDTVPNLPCEERERPTDGLLELLFVLMCAWADWADWRQKLGRSRSALPASHWIARNAVCLQLFIGLFWLSRFGGIGLLARFALGTTLLQLFDAGRCQGRWVARRFPCVALLISTDVSVAGSAAFWLQLAAFAGRACPLLIRVLAGALLTSPI